MMRHDFAGAAAPSTAAEPANITVAQLANPERIVAFDIAPQSLDSAILAFAEEAGVQVLFQSAKLDGKRSRGVRGRLTVRQALRTILDGTGFSFAFTDDESVRIFAQDGGATLRLPSILVEANKRAAEDVQTVPGSVYAFDALDLVESRARGIEDIARQTPNTFVDERPNGDVVIFLRGNSTDNTNTDAGIGIYVDGAYNFIQGNNNNFPLFDIGGVNVLLGPQGGLYGRNAVGGAINIQTADPSDQIEAAVTGEYGSSDSYRHEIVGNFPASDKLSFRIAGFDNRRDSFYFNTTNGRDENDVRQRGGRLKGKLSPTEDIDAVLTLERVEQELPGPALTPVANVDSLDTVTDIIGFNDRDSTRLNLKADWRIADWLNVRSITSYHRPDGESLIDGDSSAVVNLSVGVDFEATQFSQEFLFSSPSPLFDRLDWTIGTTYFRDRIDTDQRNSFLAGAFAGSAVDTAVEGDIDAYAVFGEGTVAITEKLKATASVRFTHEEKDISVSQAVSGPLAGFLPPAAPIDESDQYTRTKPAGTVSYQWTEDIFTYAKIATAYKSGGVNFGATPSAADAAFDPEDVISYEIGARTQWFGKRLQLNATVFHQDQSDLQLRVRDVDAALNFFDNVGDGETQGIELSARAAPVDGLTISANYGYLRARFDSASIQSGGGNVDVSDNRIPDIPSHTFNVGARYTYTIVDWLDAYARADHYLTRGGFADARNLFDLDHKNLTNLAVGVEGDHFSAQLFVENLFDNPYFEFSPTAAGLGQRNSPRIWGVSLTARW